MRLVIQRVSRAAVRVEGAVVGEVERGLMVLAAVEKEDGEAQVRAAADKLPKLRLFPDDAGRMNRNLEAAGGALLLVSQFTLAGQPLAKGLRPSFVGAAEPEEAERRFDELVARLRAAGHHVETGRFGAHMDVELVNDGPVTFVLDF